MSKKPKRYFNNQAIAQLEREGWCADSVDRQVTRTVSKDYCGMFDIIAFRGGRFPKVAGIQVTDSTNHAARRKKCLANPLLKKWIAPGRTAEVWSYNERNELRTEVLEVPDAKA